MGAFTSCCQSQSQNPPANPIGSKTVPNVNTQPDQKNDQKNGKSDNNNKNEKNVDNKRNIYNENSTQNKEVADNGKTQKDLKNGQNNKEKKSKQIQNNENVIKLQNAIDAKSQQLRKKYGVSDFEILKQIGQGGFATVYLVRKKQNQEKLYAMKIIKKKDSIKFNILQTSKIERNIMVAGLQHPNIVQLKYCFQTNSKIYYVMEYVGGGELYKLLKSIKKFSEEEAKFIVAQVILAIEFLHTEQKLIYRDLKPENILLNTDGYVKMADFGLSKHFKDPSDLTYTLAGTHEYLAPEILLKKGHNKNCDLWAIGIFCFELLHGRCPFELENNQNPNMNKFVSYVIQNNPKFSSSLSANAIDFMKKMIVVEPQNRLGAQNMNDIKQHPFFADINFTDIYKQKTQSPLLKYLQQVQKQPQKTQQARPINETPNQAGIIFPNVNGLTYQESYSKV